jgi:hypothetical protein
MKCSCLLLTVFWCNILTYIKEYMHTYMQIFSETTTENIFRYVYTSKTF